MCILVRIGVAAKATPGNKQPWPGMPANALLSTNFVVFACVGHISC